MQSWASFFLVYAVNWQNRRIIHLFTFLHFPSQGNSQPKPHKPLSLAHPARSLDFFVGQANANNRTPSSALLNKMSRFLLMQNSRVLLEELTPSC